VFEDCPIREFRHFGHQENVRAVSRKLERGEHVFRTGDSANFVVFLKSGALKTYTLSPAGEEKVISFYFPGDLVGLESMGLHRHLLSAEALSPCRVCALPCEALQDVGAPSRAALRRVLEQASRRLRCDASMLALLAHRSAEERVVAFLLELARRLSDGRAPALHFELKMTRADIASYLALAVETVSRVLTRLQEGSVIEIERNRRVHILDPGAMEAVVGTPATGPALWSGAGLRRDSGDSGRPLNSRGTSTPRVGAHR
jgi:CRP/FNR family transcriptional regulator